MIAEQVARIIAVFIMFLETTDEDKLDPDEAVEVMEYIGKLMGEFDKDFLRELVDAFPKIALEYKGASRQMVLDIPFDFYLEETLAADDPVRLAELDRLRDERDWSVTT